MGSPVRIAGWLPLWAPEAVLPVVFGLMTLRWMEQTPGRVNRIFVSAGVLAAGGIGIVFSPYMPLLLWPMVAVLIFAALIGAPIFVVLGGIALSLFLAEGVPVASIPVETYRITVSPAIAAVPLFTLAGYVLAEGGASRRIVRLFHALLGWLPGGVAIVAVLVCAFFTTFTGASGVTIIALGGLGREVRVVAVGRRFSGGRLDRRTWGALGVGSHLCSRKPQRGGRYLTGSSGLPW